MQLTDLTSASLLQSAQRKSGIETSTALLRRLERIEKGVPAIEAIDRLHQELSRISRGAPALPYDASDPTTWGRG